MIEKVILSQFSKEKKKESCGIVVETSNGLIFHPARNVSHVPENNFVIDDSDYIIASTYGDIKAIVHSHIGKNPLNHLSSNDRICQYSTASEWWLAVNGEIKKYKPIPKLKGRIFNEGYSDCYDCLKDFYALAGLDMKNYGPEDGFRIPEWHEKEGVESPFLKFLDSEGFSSGVNINDLRPGDVILSLLGSKVPNHCSLYVGNNEIFHHLPGKLSFIEPLRPYFVKFKDSIWRYTGKENLNIEAALKILRG